MSNVENEKQSSNEQPQGSKHARPSFLEGAKKYVKYLSHGSESDSGYDGAFSYAAEYHAPALGFAIGYAGTAEQQRQLITYTLGLGGAKKKFSDDAHIRDAADEPAYALAALSAGKAAKGTLHLPAMM